MDDKKTRNFFSTMAFLLFLLSTFQAVLTSQQAPNNQIGNLIISYKGTDASTLTLCNNDLPSCMLNVTCHYECLANTCNNVYIFVEFRNNSASLFKAVSTNSFDQFVLNGTKPNMHKIDNLSAGNITKTSFIIKGNLASSNNKIRCAAIADNAGQYITSLPLNVNVNAFVDISLNVTNIYFPNSNPGTENIPSLSNPVNLSNTANSNTAIDVYLKNTNMTSGKNTISYINLSLATGNTPKQSRAFKGNLFINGSAANHGYIENMPINSSARLFFFLDIERGQAIGTYNGVIIVRGVADGTAP